MANKELVEYIETLLEEKEIDKECIEFTVKYKDQIHFVNLEFLISIMGMCSTKEAISIRNTLVKIDFANGDVLHFFEHLANGYIKTNY